MTNKVRGGVMGLCVADALGVPVEFVDREALVKDPVLDMTGYGTFNLPAGTWSDDTSMTLCLADSLAKGLDYNDMMMNFSKWFHNGEYTPFGRAFGVGNTTREALMRFENGTPAIECGGKTAYDNGNGSLMRILPMLFYVQSAYGLEWKDNAEALEVVHHASGLTHAHKRSKIACGMYILIADNLTTGADLHTAVRQGINDAMVHYRKRPAYTEELTHYKRLDKQGFQQLSSDKIKSSGYVVDTLEAALWSLLKTDSYRACVLKAVNLGGDTDTVAAVAGGLAGLYYGYDSIPEKWLATIINRPFIEKICHQLMD